MGKGDSKRKKIFDLYSRNLKDVLTLTGAHLKRDDSGEVMEFEEPAVLCPLCMVLFPESHLHVNNKYRLTIEHVPPRSVGGKGKILTCKRCNENIGDTLDHHIQKEMAIEPFLRGLPNATVQAKLRINGHIPLRTTITFNKDSIGLAPQWDRNIERQYRVAMDDLQENWNGAKLDFHFFGGGEQKKGLLGSCEVGIP